MVTINNSDELKDWLTGKPRKFSVVMASRTALRVVPVLGELFDIERLAVTPSIILFAVFRALALPFAASKYPLEGKGWTDHILHTFRAANDAGIAAGVVDVAGAAGAAAGAAAFAADAAVEAARDAGTAASAAGAAAFTAVEAARDAGTAVFAAFAADANLLEGRMKPEMLTRQPLWPDKEMGGLGERWQNFKNKLLALNQDWQVWTGWYEDIVAGRNRAGLPNDLAEELDLKIATQDDDWWQRDAVAVNKDITDWTAAALGKARGRNETNEHLQNGAKEVMADLETLEAEAQEPYALRFISTDSGPVNVDVRFGAANLLDDQDAVDRHAEVKRLSNRLVLSYDPSERGANAAKEVVEDTRLLLEVLGKVPREARPGLLIPRGDALRQIRAMQENLDEFSDVAPLSDRFKLALDNLVGAYNVFVGLDPGLANRDEARFGPDAQKDLVPPGEGQMAAKSAQELGAATEQAEEALAEEAKVTPAKPDPENRRSRRYSEGVKNLSRALLAKAIGAVGWIRRHPTKFSVGVITGAGSAGLVSLRWVLANESWLLGAFAHNPIMLEIVTKVVEIAKILPLA